MTHEEQMIQDVLDQKTDSFRWIIERYQHPVFRIIFNLVGDHHTAEDITQDVFLTVYQKLSTFDPMRSRFSTWLFTIARNKSINVLRKGKREASMNLQTMTVSENPSAQTNHEFFQYMYAVLNQLPQRQKRAFMLAEFEKLSYDRIAQIECVSIGTVKSRIHRARQKLRKAFQRLSGE